ncbi:hypothetical protein GXP67_26815 [Rhodocytophaga rosea]|uniref:Uncharacterized protein n=1 Tax=Rhodocytophaga rosea TaxID=2704465 RepID=A0A6C0GPL6_9BACT|nr:hypothetical protein [Rhodocytophaga rosea]QHT69999.1 hypothetical protein GXP67_26815 [Rhodocytophaga rosea]
MKEYRKLTNWTIVFNLLIVIGAGHGIGILSLIEVFLLPEILVDGLTFSFQSTYEKRLEVAALLSILGQCMLISSYFIKVDAIKLLIKIFSIGILWVGFIYLTYDFTSNSAANLSLITGIPFLIISLLLMVRQSIHFIIWKVETADSK